MGSRIKKGHFFLIFILFLCSSMTMAEGLFFPATAFIYPESDEGVDFIRENSLQLLSWPTYKPNYFYAPVVLPQGASVSSIVLFYQDNDYYANMEFKLTRLDMYNKTEQTMVEYTTSGSSWLDKEVGVSSVKYRIIHNPRYVYRLRVKFSRASSRLVLYGIKVHYKPAL